MHTIPKPLIYSALAFCLMSWASSYIAIKVAVTTFEPHHVAVLRFVVASLCLAFFLPKARPTMPSGGDILKLFAYGIAGIAVYNILLCGAERGVNAGTASFIIGIAPIFAAVLASIGLKEKISKGGWIGLFIAFAGAAMMSAGKAHGFTFQIEILALLAAAFLAALSFALQKSLLKRIAPLACTIYGVWAGTLLLLPFLGGALEAAAHAPAVAIFSVVYLGVVPAAIGYICWSFILAHTPTGRAAAFLYLVPPAAVLQSAVMLGEVPGSWELAGAGVIMLALVGTSPKFSSMLQELRRTVEAVLKESMRKKLLPLCEECD